MVKVTRIMIPTDLSEHSMAALEFASTLSLLYSARLYILHVEDVAPPPMYGTHVHDIDVKHFHHQALADSKRDLENFARANIDSDLKAHLVVRLGDAVEEITEFADEEGIDLIVMATHGRTGLKHVLMGSIAEKVVRHSPVPVLTVKPKALREQVISSGDIENDLHIS